MKYLAWAEIILCLVISIGLIIFAFVGTDHPIVFLRGLIIIPLGLWWGIRTLKQEARAAKE